MPASFAPVSQVPMQYDRAYYPVFLDLRGRGCVVIGGGPVAERKVMGALGAGARVTVVSPDVTEPLARLAESGRIDLMRREFRKGDLTGADLAFAATDRADVNREVAAEAGAERVLLNSASESEPGDFILPSVIRRGAVHVALSTGGASPAYARMLRERLEEVLGPEHEALVEFLGELRPRVMARFRDDAARRRAVWDRIVTWETVELIREQRWDRIEEMVAECLSS